MEVVCARVCVCVCGCPKWWCCRGSKVHGESKLGKEQMVVEAVA
jgi:hypothetical protein